MREGDRCVLTIDEPAVIRKVLKTLSAAIVSEPCKSPEIGRQLKAFAKRECDAVILNLRVIEESSGDPAPKVVGASLVGGVLVIACIGTNSWLLQIEKLTHRASVPKSLVSGLASFFLGLF